MRSMLVLAAATLSLAAGVSLTAPAAAGDLMVKAPDGYAQDRTVNHWVYYPKYHHVYHVADRNEADPYAWTYSPRGYYPDYASRYWVPAEQMRYRYRYRFTGPKFKYHPAWGAAKPGAAQDQADDGHGGLAFWRW